MNENIENTGTIVKENISKITPECPFFGTCGGCLYQNIPYDKELNIKYQNLKKLLSQNIDLGENILEPIVGSPENYYYRNKLDLTLRRRQGKWLMGFVLEGRHRLLEVDKCFIARREISDFLPVLKELAIKRIPEDYRTANLVVRTGDEGKVFWGGIGRRSLQMKEEDYLWTEIRGRKIFYSLETFFQANLSILEKVTEKIIELGDWTPETVFFDLYSGVGLFGMLVSDLAKKIVMIEESKSSLKLAEYNVNYHQNKNIEIHSGKVEDVLPAMLSNSRSDKNICFIDPPRRGLSETSIKTLIDSKNIHSLFYLSCSPETLTRDLKVLVSGGWKIDKIIPFDFFPRTKHLETLGFLRR